MLKKFSKKYLSFFLVTMLMILFMGNYFLYKPAISITSNINQFQFHTYDDSQQGGNSSSTVKIDGEKIVFKYVKREGFKTPYAALVIERPDYSYFKLAGYKAIIEGDVTGVSYVVFRLVQKNKLKPESKMSSDKDLIVFNEKPIYKHDGVLDQEVDLSELQPPWWWMKNNYDIDKNVPKTSFDETLRITFDHAIGIPFGQESVVTIKNLRFEHPMIGLKVFNLFFLLIILIFILTLAYKEQLGKSKVKTNIKVVSAPFLHQKQSETISDVELMKIVEYLSINYNDNTLNLPKFATDLGISERKISELIKKEYNHTFKQHLNFLRISEAKLLLLNPGLQIQEISYKTGYDSPVHFIRVFKSILGITPSEFRKSNNL